jgi:hypothetical protein
MGLAQHGCTPAGAPHRPVALTQASLCPPRSSATPTAIAARPRSGHLLSGALSTPSHNHSSFGTASPRVPDPQPLSAEFRLDARSQTNANEATRWRQSYEELFVALEQKEALWSHERTALRSALSSLQEGGGEICGASGQERVGNPFLEPSATPTLAECPPLQLVEAASREAVAAGTMKFGGGVVAFERWLKEQLDEESVRSLERVPALLTCCRAAALGSRQTPEANANAADGSVSQCRVSALGFYKPDKSDPVDCLVAARLLRSGHRSRPLPFQCPSVARLGPGAYLVGDTQVACRMERGRLLVRPAQRRGSDASGKSEDGGAYAPNWVATEEEVEFDDFLSALASPAVIPEALAHTSIMTLGPVAVAA